MKGGGWVGVDREGMSEGMQGRVDGISEGK